MAVLDKTVTEENIFFVLIVFLIFLVVNFDPEMANVFTLMIIADIILYVLDKFVWNKRISYPFESNPTNRFKSVLESLIIFGAFIIFQSFLLRFLSPSITSAAQSIKAFFSLYSTTTPALQGNVLITLVAFGIIVPFVETRFFFGRVYEKLADLLDMRGGLDSAKTWALATFIGIIFALYHLTARRCGAAETCQSTTLFITFVFGLLSVLMVSHYKETKQAVLVHIATNLIAVSISLGLLNALMGI